MCTKHLNILIAQKNKLDSILLEREISHCFNTAFIRFINADYELFEQIKEKQFDFIIIDCDIVAEDLTEFLRKINASEQSSSIIYLTDDSSEEKVRAIKKSGIDNILVKNESSYVVVPRLMKDIIGTKILDDNFSRLKLNKKINKFHPEDSVGLLSHEINNPLMTILGMAELILSDNRVDDKEVENKVRVIHNSANRIRKALIKLRKTSTENRRNNDFLLVNDDLLPGEKLKR